jgi:hypothetical protein
MPQQENANPSDEQQSPSPIFINPNNPIKDPGKSFD